MAAVIQVPSPNTTGPAYATTGTGGSATAASGLTYSNTLNGGTTALAWLVFANNAGNSTITSVTYGGTAMTQLGSPLLCATGSGFSYWMTAFILQGILGSARNLIVTPAAASTYMKSNVVAYPNVRSWASPVTNTGTGTSLSHTVSSAASRMVGQMFWVPLSSAISSYNQNSRWNNGAAGTWATPALIGDAAGAGSVSFTATGASSSAWGSMAIELS
jgi:hypothetical protein